MASSMEYAALYEGQDGNMSAAYPGSEYKPTFKVVYAQCQQLAWDIVLSQGMLEGVDHLFTLNNIVREMRASNDQPTPAQCEWFWRMGGQFIFDAQKCEVYNHFGSPPVDAPCLQKEENCPQWEQFPMECPLGCDWVLADLFDQGWSLTPTPLIEPVKELPKAQASEKAITEAPRISEENKRLIELCDSGLSYAEVSKCWRSEKGKELCRYAIRLRYEIWKAVELGIPVSEVPPKPRAKSGRKPKSK